MTKNQDGQPDQQNPQASKPGEVIMAAKEAASLAFAALAESRRGMILSDPKQRT